MKATNISAGAAQSGYYKAEGYYSSESDEGTKSAEWFGQAATELGLEGAVDDFLFERILNGETFERGPAGLQEGRIMGKWENGERKHRAGIDLTFSAPKSVSIAALVFKDDRVVQAHKDAVAATLEIVEKELVQTRKSQGGKMITETGGKIIAGVFLHDTSRAYDPQMHSHAAIANMVMDDNGKFTSLANEQIMQAVTFGSESYRSYLAKNLEKLGYTVEREGQHRFVSIKEVTQEVQDIFSKRTQEIDKSILEHGVENVPKNRELAALATRVTKDRTIDREKLHSEWLKEAKENGIDLDAIAREIDKTKERAANYVAPELKSDTRQDLAHQAVLKGIAHVSETATTYSKTQVLKAATNFADDKITPADVLRSVNEAIKSKQMLPAKEYSIHGKASEELYTDAESLLTEKKIVNAYRLTQNRSQLPRSFEGRSLAGHLDQSLRRSTLSDGQKDAVKTALTGNSLFVAVQGYAGSGKTFALSFLDDKAKQYGFHVEGLAPSHQATGLLKEALPNAETLAARLTRGTARKDAPAPEKTILVVDEASFVSNNQMLTFMKQAREQNYARVVLVGDVKQLDGVEAGTPFDLLQKIKMPTAIMSDIVRQRDDNLLSAVHHSIAGEIKEAFEKIGDNIRVPKDKDYAKAAAESYLSRSSDERAATTITTPSNDVRKAVNEHVRDGLKQQGLVGSQETELKVLVAERLSRVQAKEIHSYRDGDVVVSRSSIKSAGLSKGAVYDLNVDSQYKAMTLTNRASGEVIDFDPSKSSQVANAVNLYQEETQNFSSGDLVKFGIADKKNSINNGDQGQIKTIGDSNIIVEMKDGRTVELQNETLALKGMDYAYSLTAHGVQGASVKNIIVAMGANEYLADQKGFYVGISRGVESATLVTDDPERLAQRLEKQTGERIGALEAYGLALKEQEKMEAKLAEENAKSTEKVVDKSTQKEVETDQKLSTNDQQNEQKNNLSASETTSPGEEKPSDRETKSSLDAPNQSGKAANLSSEEKAHDASIEQLVQNVKDAAEQKERGERS